MRIIAFIKDEEVIPKIPKHLGLLEVNTDRRHRLMHLA